MEAKTNQADAKSGEPKWLFHILSFITWSQNSWISTNICISQKKVYCTHQRSTNSRTPTTLKSNLILDLLWLFWSRSQERAKIKGEISVFSYPGRMIANSIPARLVASRMRVALPRACACHCNAHAHGHTMRACARPYHAHAHGYDMHIAELW